VRAYWADRLRANPFGTMAALAAIVLGMLGALFGDMVSQGMTVSLRESAPMVAHLWGLMFTCGGTIKLVGLYGRRAAWEIPGLWMMFGGYCFYSITVVAGLGRHGLAAGIISGALAVGCMLKARTIMRAAGVVAQANTGGEPGDGSDGGR
jgi:hypothetical protein